MYKALFTIVFAASSAWFLLPVSLYLSIAVFVLSFLVFGLPKLRKKVKRDRFFQNAKLATEIIQKHSERY